MSDGLPPAKRLFLTWSDNACKLIAKQLLSLGQANPEQPCVVVVPTRESVRLLREQLAIQSAANSTQRAYLSPRIMPLNQLVGTPASMKPASPAAQLGTWLQLLRKQARFFPQLFPSCEQWNEEAYLLAAQQQLNLYHELAQESLDCKHPLWLDIAEHDKRWLDLKKLQELYRAQLAEQQLADPDEFLSCTVPNTSRIILAAVPNITRAAQKALQEGGYEVELWLHANPEHDSAFDDWGRPKAPWLEEATAAELNMDGEYWQEHYSLCADVWKMGEKATIRAAIQNKSLDSCLHAVALGACDADIEPSLEEELLHHGCGVYRPRGLSFAVSGWSQLLQNLQLLTRQLELGHISPDDRGNYPAAPLLSMFKQPLIHSIVLNPEQVSELMALLDLVQFESIPDRASSLLFEINKRQRYSKYADLAPMLGAALEQFIQWLSATISSPQNLLPSLKQLALQQSHTCVLGGTDLLLHRQFSSAFIDLIDDLLENAHQLKGLSCHLVLQLLEKLAQSTVAQAPRGDQDLSLMGWMELSFSPAKHILICGLHDKIVPERWGEDIFLTAQAREALALPTNEDRAARDAFLLRSLLGCRPKAVDFYFSLFNSKLDPLAPCSLLMRICPKDKLVELTELFFAQQEDCPSTESAAYNSEGWQYPSINPQLLKKEQIIHSTLEELGYPNPLANRAFSPSLLRGFLQCPLRFWLQHLFQLNSTTYEEDKKNLSSAELGNCMHSTLEHFITRYPSYQSFREQHPDCPEQASTGNSSLLMQLNTALEHSFATIYKSQYNNNSQLPQELQRMDMLERLHQYAPVQVQLWQDGWESARDPQGKLMLEYSPNWTFRGHRTKVKIDRVDTRWVDGVQEFLVIDYKTGRGISSCAEEHLEYCGPAPIEKTHEYLSPDLEPCIRPTKKYDKLYRWKNLQLPFYTAWLSEQYPAAPLYCGYIHLSTELNEKKLHLWPKDEQDSFFPTAYEWMDGIMTLIERGAGLVSAEQLLWKKPADYIFPELIGQEDLLDVFVSGINTQPTL